MVHSAAKGEKTAAAVAAAVVSTLGSQQLSGINATKQSLLKTLKRLGTEVDEDWPFEQVMKVGLEDMPNHWRKRDSNSEIAFQGLLTILEYCLQHNF